MDAVIVLSLTPTPEEVRDLAKLDRPVAVATTPRVTAAQAAATARDALRATATGTPQLVVDAIGGTGRLAWQVPVTAPTAKVTAMYFDHRWASTSASRSSCRRAR